VAKKDPEPTKPAAKTEPAEATAKPPAGTKKAQPVPVHGPDSFIDRLQPHIKQIAVGALALFLVIGGYVTWSWMKSRGAAKDTAKLAAGLDLARAKIESTPTTPGPGDPPSKEQSFASAKDRAAAAADAFAQGGGVAKKNALYEASLLVDAGKLDQAEALYRDHAQDPGVDGALAREGMGYVLEARAAAAKDPAEQQKLYEQALDAFKQVQPDDKGPRRDYALYDQARVLKQLNKRAEARTALDQALKAAPNSEIKTDIEAQLAQLEGS
jgi:tetratricopeptide (TPR) repeat protein